MEDSISPGASSFPLDGLACNLHATAVDVHGRGVLLVGPSGAGKSGLALQLMALGAGLIADDRVPIEKPAPELLMIHPPKLLAGHIEAWGMGILKAPAVGPTPARLVVDMGCVEKDRLPPLRHCIILGVQLPLLYRVDAALFPAALIQLVKGGRAEL